MQFKELRDILTNNLDDKENGTALKLRLPNTPFDILEQVYIDHGKKAEFQSQYSEIDISALHWSQIECPAKVIINCDVYEEFLNWFNTVQDRIIQFDEKKWKCIDTRKNVQEYWSNNKTWLRSPIFFDTTIFTTSSRLKLVEGHTRVGILTGLVTNNILSNSTTHKIWVGSYEKLNN